MPPLPPAAKCLKVTLVHNTGGDTNVDNILHFQYTGGPPAAADCLAIAGAINAQYASALHGMLATAYSLSAVRVLDIDSNTGAEAENDTAVPGTRVGTITTINNCVVVSHSIARRYRGGHPRSYTPFGVASDLGTNQHWISTFVTSVTSAWSSFITGVLTTTSGTTVISKYVSVSYYSGRALRATPVVDPILASFAQLRVGSQRRRLGK